MLQSILRSKDELKCWDLCCNVLGIGGFKVDFAIFIYAKVNGC